MAIKRWVAQAVAIADVFTVLLSGTVISQTYSLTINGKSVTYVAGGGDTVSTILAGLAAAWNASLFAEFAELTAAALPSGGPYTSLVLTADVPGRPSVIAKSTTGAATFTITNTVAATGPYSLGNPANLSTNTALANGDTLLFDYGSTPCKYDLATSLTGVTVQIDPGYSGQIGLPYTNADTPTTPYQEYRTTSLTLAGGTVVVNSQNCQCVNVATGAVNTSAIRVLNCGSRLDASTPPVLITGGTAASVLDISKGDVGIALYPGTTAQFLSVLTSYVASQLQDVVLAIGSGATIATLNKNGGTLTTKAAVTTLTQGVAGGTTTVADSASVATLDIQGGKVVYNSTGTLGSANVANSGILDFNQDQRGKTVTNPIQLYGDNAWVLDDMKVVNSGVLSVKCNRTSKMNISHGSDNTITLT